MLGSTVVGVMSSLEISEEFPEGWLLPLLTSAPMLPTGGTLHRNHI